jgi:ribosome production factor 2
VKSATELGIKADSLGIVKKRAKTHKGRKILEARAPQIIEGPKKSIFMRGKKTSQKVLDLMRDLHLQRGSSDLSKLFLRTSYDIHPFDDIGAIEQQANKQGSHLFACGTHQKKRPDNLIFGRTYHDHILDLFEFAVSDYVP